VCVWIGRCLWEILTEESVGVLVRPALPRRFRVTEVHVDAGIDRERGMLGHFFALVPRQRLPQMIRESLDRVGQRDPDGLCSFVYRMEQH
jgi:hypothetical protein